MRYLLGVGFLCFLYKKRPVSRIYVNQKLIDEFEIKEFDKIENFNKIDLFTHIKNDTLNKYIWEINKYSYDDLNKEQKLKHQESFFNNQARHIDKTPLLNLYEIDIDASVENLNISINIKNNDNNYVNGFMTKFTSLKIVAFFLIPKDRSIAKRFNDRYRKRRNIYSIGTSDKIFNNQIFDLLRHVKLNKFKDDNINSFHGDSGEFTCNLRKKYGIFLPYMEKSYNFFSPGTFLTYIYNKYQHYENQRNTD
jgi:hypothetical protein